MLEISMEEMVMFEVNNPPANSLAPFQDFKEVFKRFLLTQYGLPHLAEKNYKQILNRINELSRVGGNFYAQLILLIFDVKSENKEVPMLFPGLKH
jgi:hypothetical protein